MFDKKGLIAEAEAALKAFEKANSDMQRNDLVNSAMYNKYFMAVEEAKAELKRYENHLDNLRGKYKEDINGQISEFEGKIKGFEFKIKNETSYFVNSLKAYTNAINEMEYKIMSTKDENQKSLFEFDKLLLEAERYSTILQEYPKIKESVDKHKTEIAECNRQITMLKNNYKDGLLDTALKIEELSGKAVDIKNEMIGG